MRRRLITAAIVAVCATTFTFTTASASPATAPGVTQTYQISGTDIGIMFRSDPDNWESRSGRAGYDGDNVTLVCETTGTPVGDINNHMWYWSTNSLGSGFLPDHYLNTPTSSNEWLSGLPRCDDLDIVDDQAPPPKSVFFSGTDISKGSSTNPVADVDYALSQWASGGDCKGDHIPGLVPDTVNTLAGWSRGRIGPVYFLAYASDEQRGHIHRIILFDPGATSDIAGSFSILHRNHGCDYEYDVNRLLADWLKSDSSNQLIVITGVKSEMKEDSSNPSSKSTYAGLWEYYFAGIWNQPFADRALVCDYNTISHAEALSQFAGIVKSPQSNCPSAPEGHELQAWHP